MYEKPQYLTPDGFRRSAENPLKKTRMQKAVKKAVIKKKLSSDRALSTYTGIKKPERGISKEAAQLIAKAIKGMLHE